MERGIVERNVDDTKTDESRKTYFTNLLIRACHGPKARDGTRRRGWLENVKCKGGLDWGHSFEGVVYRSGKMLPPLPDNATANVNGVSSCPD